MVQLAVIAASPACETANGPAQDAVGARRSVVRLFQVAEDTGRGCVTVTPLPALPAVDGLTTWSTTLYTMMPSPQVN